ncbi:MAG: MoxR family ATPase [Pseudomonadota bacterium]
MTTSAPISRIGDSDQAREALSRAVQTLDNVILGKRDEIKLALTCLLAGGHLLIEDVPGVGKTTLARALAQVLGLQFARVQFTSDLLPADVTGISVYDKPSGEFRFIRGPVFTEMLLADEINRATPKAQSALLEAMQERQVTVEGEPHALPEPFFVVATQNPQDQIGTFALPESQLDRFLMRIRLGYPDAVSERQLLTGAHQSQRPEDVEAELSASGILALRALVASVKMADPVLNYLQALVEFTRTSPLYALGLSPRASIALADAARAYALIEGRLAVYPEDLKNIFVAIASHRLTPGDEHRGSNGESLAEAALNAVAIP